MCGVDTRVWHIVEEIVRFTLFPAPTNPFALDPTYFDLLGATESALASAAMIQFLRHVCVSDAMPPALRDAGT